MSKEFYNIFKVKLKIVSSYRSFKYQQSIKDRWCPDNLCAKAWYSEHQSGLALDLFETTTYSEFLSKPKLRLYYKWLSLNAHNYWFTNTYTKWLEIDWYEKEPWHWRYIWIKLASHLKQFNFSIAEFYIKNNN
jgi:D-alanyl-D-alanine carboxypeptidase